MKESIIISTKKEDVLYLNKTILNFYRVSNENAKKICFEHFLLKKNRYFLTVLNVIKSIKNLHDNQLSFYGQNIENNVCFFFNTLKSLMMISIPNRFIC